MSVEVVWSGTNEDDDDFAHPEIKRNWYLAPPWAGVASNGEAIAEDLAEFWMDGTAWRDLVGQDDDRCRVLIEVHSPPVIAGRYQVDCERVTKARARKLVPSC